MYDGVKLYGCYICGCLFGFEVVLKKYLMFYNG